MSDQPFPGNDGYAGVAQVTDALSRFSAITLVVNQILAGVATSQLVQVLGVTPGAGLLPGTVNVQPLVNQLDGAGNAVPHGTVYGLPFMRLQGGANAVIIDPEVGDIGLAVFAMRDISSVKSNRARSNPGSKRRFDMADGLYFGGFLNRLPTQYVRFLAAGAGIEMVSPTKVLVTTPVVEIDGLLRVTGAVTAGFGTGDQVGLQTHTHPDPQGGNTGSPNPGS